MSLPYVSAVASELDGATVNILSIDKANNVTFADVI
jgi:hypothetical protein